MFFLQYVSRFSLIFAILGTINNSLCYSTLSLEGGLKSLFSGLTAGGGGVVRC